MANYTKATNFASKDALTTGNPLKTLSGTELDDEFNNIATAVSTKANSSQLALIKEAIYPVGSVYISVGGTNPATFLGVGTWVAFGAGRTLVGRDISDTDFDVAEETGGAKTHTLTESEIPSHHHTLNTGVDAAGYSAGYWGEFPYNYNSLGNNTRVRDTNTKGGDVPHNNLQPYIVVYFWKRTV